jgi:peptide deformylase
MAFMDIYVAGNPVLRKATEKVTNFDKKLGKLLDNMAATMYHADGCGLAGPQVGVAKKLLVIDAFDDKGIREFINPEIVEHTGDIVSTEGCLSVPDYEGEVRRASEVTVEYQDRKGEKKELKADGLLAIALQHEIDHINGVLFIDKAISIKPKVKEDLK